MYYFCNVKLKLAFILSILIFTASIQDGVSQISSYIMSIEGCCAKTALEQTDRCVDKTADDAAKADTCCEGDACDCSCCFHISLYSTFLTNIGNFDVQEADRYMYISILGTPTTFPVFHPPLV